MSFPPRSVGEIAEFFDHVRVPLSGAEREGRRGGFRYFGAQGVIDSVDDFLFDGQYVLVAEDGANLNTRNEPIAFLVEGQFWVNNHAHVLQGKPQIADSRFLAYAINRASVAGLITGAAQPKLTQANLRLLQLPAPDFVLQVRIADTLAQFDDLIANNQRRITLLEEAARQLYREWFVRLRFPGAEHTAIVDGVPEGWRRIVLKDICSKIGSGFTPRGGEASYVESGVPLIRSQNVYDDRFDVSGLAFLTDDQAEEMEGVSVASRDILLNITGASVARCCMVPDALLPARVNQHVMILRVADDSVSPHFVLGALNSGLHKRQLHSLAQKGATRQALTKEMMENFGIVVASAGIMREFHEIVEPNFQLRQNLTRQNAKLRTARDLLLPRLMSGELTP